MLKQELIDFEEEIRVLFEAGKIKAPVHFSVGSEDELIEIFKQVKPTDWVFSTHRSHYHALLKGIPKEWVRNEILAGRSMHLNSREHNFFTSSIVAGICPIAVGVAMTGEKVWCFVGDMAGETGIFHECVKYAHGLKLPIKFVVEDNHYSVDTPTELIWRYNYERKYPHMGSAAWVIF